jgi:hypothetical protein
MSEQSVAQEALKVAIRADQKVDSHAAADATMFNLMQTQLESLGTKLDAMTHGISEKFRALYKLLWTVVGGAFLLGCSMIAYFYIEADRAQRQVYQLQTIQKDRGH